jgi:hypothetical protein
LSKQLLVFAEGHSVARGIYLLEEVYFHPMNSTNPREYLQWLVD